MEYGRLNKGTGGIRSKDPTDECYTSDWLVQDLLTPVLPHLRGLRVLSPCDSEESAYVKFLSKYAEEYGYEYRYSDSDMFINPDVEWCDIVITNPPFSKEVRFWEECLNPLQKDWILMCMLGSYSRLRAASHSFRTYEPSQAEFRTPKGNRRIGVTCFSSTDWLVENTHGSVYGENEWETISIMELKEPYRSYLFSIGVRTVEYSDRSYKVMKPMEKGKYYVIPSTDSGHLASNMEYVRSFNDTLDLTARGKGYLRIVVRLK